MATVILIANLGLLGAMASAVGLLARTRARIRAPISHGVQALDVADGSPLLDELAA
jgi:hypothetical protein